MRGVASDGVKLTQARALLAGARAAYGHTHLWLQLDAALNPTGGLRDGPTYDVVGVVCVVGADGAISVKPAIESDYEDRG